MTTVDVYLKYEGVFASFEQTRPSKFCCLYREHRGTDPLCRWINKNYQGFKHPYGNSRGVPQAAFNRAKNVGNQTGMDALVKAFTHNDGAPLWQERI